MAPRQGGIEVHRSRGRARLALLVIVSGVVLCSIGAVDGQKEKPRAGSGWKSLEIYASGQAGMDFWLFDPKGGSAWLQSPNLRSTIPDCEIETLDDVSIDPDSSWEPGEAGYFRVRSPAAGVWRVKAIVYPSADTALGNVSVTLRGEGLPSRDAEVGFILAPGDSLQWKLKVAGPESKDVLKLVRELGRGQVYRSRDRSHEVK